MKVPFQRHSGSLDGLVLNRPWLEHIWERHASNSTQEAEHGHCHLVSSYEVPGTKTLATLHSLSKGFVHRGYTWSASRRPLRAKLRVLSTFSDSLGLTAFPNKCPWKAGEGAGKLNTETCGVFLCRGKMEARAALHKSWKGLKRMFCFLVTNVAYP